MVHACLMLSILLYIDHLLESLMELFCCLGVLAVCGGGPDSTVTTDMIDQELGLCSILFCGKYHEEKRVECPS